MRIVLSLMVAAAAHVIPAGALLRYASAQAPVTPQRGFLRWAETAQMPSDASLVAPVAAAGAAPLSLRLDGANISANGDEDQPAAPARTAAVNWLDSLPGRARNSSGNRSIELLLSQFLTHDSNVLRLPANAAAIPGVASKADNISATTIGLRVDKEYSQQRIQFDVTCDTSNGLGEVKMVTRTGKHHHESKQQVVRVDAHVEEDCTGEQRYDQGDWTDPAVRQLQ
jgi:hypothetical protein